jgi:hypothetical protein
VAAEKTEEMGNALQCKKGEMEKRGKGEEELLRENFMPSSPSAISIFPLSLFSLH